MPSNSSESSPPPGASPDRGPQRFFGDYAAWGIDYSTFGIWIGVRDRNGHGSFSRRVSEPEDFHDRLAELHEITESCALTAELNHPPKAIAVEIPTHRPMLMAYGVVIAAVRHILPGTPIFAVSAPEWRKTLGYRKAADGNHKEWSKALAIEWGYDVDDNHADAMNMAEWLWRSVTEVTKA